MAVSNIIYHIVGNFIETVDGQSGFSSNTYFETDAMDSVDIGLSSDAILNIEGKTGSNVDDIYFFKVSHSVIIYHIFSYIYYLNRDHMDMIFIQKKVDY